MGFVGFETFTALMWACACEWVRRDVQEEY